MKKYISYEYVHSKLKKRITPYVMFIVADGVDGNYFNYCILYRFIVIIFQMVIM